MERKGITRILTGMLFLSPLISDAWRYGTYTKEFRGNWPLNTDNKDTEDIKFAEGKVPEDVLEGVASSELNNAGFQAIKPDTYDEAREYWKMKEISAEMLKPFGEDADAALAKGPTYECMRNPMVCISKDKDPKECVKKVHFYDLTDTGSYSAFQTIKFDDKGEADLNDDQFYALLAPTLYCSMDYSKVVPVDDGKPAAFYEGGEFPEDNKTQRETQCFNVRGDAQLFIDFGTKAETWTEAGDAPIQVHCSMIVYQMPKDTKDGKKWWLHTGPAIFGPELDTLKPDAGDCIPRQYTAIIEQMNGVEILTAGNATKLETSAVAYGLGNDRVGFLSDCSSTFYDAEKGGSCDHSTDYNYHNIEVTAAHGGTVRTRVLSTDKDGKQIAFDTLHVILPHPTGLALQEKVVNPARLALNDAGKELAAVVGDLEAIQKRANETKDISVPEKFGSAIDLVEKFWKGEKFSFGDVPGDDEKKDEEKKDDKKKDDGGEGKSFEELVNDALAKFRKETAGFEDAAKAIGLDTLKNGADVNKKVQEINGPEKDKFNKPIPRKISKEIEEKLAAYADCNSQLEKYQKAPMPMLQDAARNNLQKNLKKLGLTVAEPKKKKKDDDKKEEQIWTETELPGKYAAIKKEYDEFLKNLPDSKFKTAALTVAWGSTHKEMGPGGEVDVPDNLEDLLKDKADAKALYDGDFKKHFELYNDCRVSMCDVTLIIDGKMKIPFPASGKSTQQIMLENIQSKLQELRKLLVIAGEEKKDEEKKEEKKEHHEDGEDKHTPPFGIDFPGKIDVGGDAELQNINSQLLILFNSNAELKAAAGKIDWTKADANEKIDTLTGDGISDAIKEQLRAYLSIFSKINQCKSDPFVKVVNLAGLQTDVSTFIVANYKLETVLGSKKDWRPEEIPMGMQKISIGLSLIESDNETNEYNAFAKAAAEVNKDETSFINLIEKQTEDLQKQLKAYTATYHCLFKTQGDYNKNTLKEALFNLGVAQVCWNRLNMFLDGKEPVIAALDGDAKTAQDNYKVTAGGYNTTLQDIINQAKALTGELDRKKFNEALYNCWNQYTAYTAMIDAMTPTNVDGPRDIRKAIEYYGTDLKDKYLVELQNAFNALKAAHDELIVKLATDIKNLQSEVDGKLGDIKALADWTQAEKDILSALKDDVGKQLKAKLYKFYHDAITAAEATKDTNIAEAQKKLKQAHQYYDAIQALLNSGCDFTKLAGALENNKLEKDDVGKSIKAVAAALDALHSIVSLISAEFASIFEDCGTLIKIETILNDDELYGKDKIVPCVEQMQTVFESKKSLPDDQREILETYIVAVERLISAQYTEKVEGKEEGADPQKLSVTRQRKLGLSQNALLQFINPDAIAKNPLAENQKTKQSEFQNKYKAVDDSISKLREKAGEKETWTPVFKQRFVTAMSTRYALEVLSKGMTPTNSGKENLYGMIKQGDRLSELLTSQISATENQLNQDQANKLKNDIEAANKEKEDFANDLKDYEDFKKIFGEINWESDDVAGQIATQAGENKELEAQLKLYQQYLAALKEAEEKRETNPGEAQTALESAKKHLADLKKQLEESNLPKGNPDWTEGQAKDYENLIKWYQRKVEWISAIEKKAREVWGDSPIEDYTTKLDKPKEDLQKYREGIAALSKATQAEFGGQYSGGKCQTTYALSEAASKSIRALESTIPLSDEQNKWTKDFRNNCENLEKQMKELQDQVNKWYNEDTEHRSAGVIQIQTKAFNDQIMPIRSRLEDMNGFSYEYVKTGKHPLLSWKFEYCPLDSLCDQAQTALDQAKEAFEAAKKAAGASQEIKEQYNKCNALYTELMTKQNELKAKIINIVIDESWSDKTAMEAKKSEAEKALNEYNKKLTGLQTALNSALNESDQKAALTNVKQELENAQKELNDSINKTVSDFEGAVTEAQKKAQEAAEKAQIPQKLITVGGKLFSKLEPVVKKFNSTPWNQYLKVLSIYNEIHKKLLSNPSKSVNDWIQDDDFYSKCQELKREIEALKELTTPAPSSSQSHSGSHQQSPQTSQTSSYSKMNQSNVSAPTSPSRGRGKVAPGRYTLRESQAVLSGKRKSIREVSPKRLSRSR